MPPRRSPRLAVWKRDMKLTYADHITHTNHLLKESIRLMFEHASYELYCWILSFLAGSDSTTQYRLSVYPQPRLIWEGLVSGDDGEYKPTDSEDSQEETTGDNDSEHASDCTDSSTNSPRYANSSATESSEVEEHQPEAARVMLSRRGSRMNPGRSIVNQDSVQPRESQAAPREPRARTIAADRASRNSAGDDPDDSEYELEDDDEHTDSMSRYPDFLVSLTLPSKPMGVHTLWEIKRLHKNEGWLRKTAEDKVKTVVVTFEAMKRQILEGAACAFNQYPMHNSMRYVAVVGYYLRFITFQRDSMPPADFNWKDKSKSQRMKVNQYFEDNIPSQVYHLLNYPSTDDYSEAFKEYWDDSLTEALDEIIYAEDGDSNAGVIEDLSKKINGLILKDRGN
ncbi:hypothetical protein NM688_g5972 [Phlebia brevispora]|uniref:Uncharacterized protein n=1 Tax=Phlebia brevispora TaxID=194682 RepID=A0ACC1SM28_9APHY|nr:hypothetical protein NM688_g5972 [Phlebia brevispora]